VDFDVVSDKNSRSVAGGWLARRVTKSQVHDSPGELRKGHSRLNSLFRYFEKMAFSEPKLDRWSFFRCERGMHPMV
jgi:hypothetical protein